MANLFKAAEILKVALRIEENGRDYYLEAKKKASSQKVAELFQYLAGEESKHLAIFSDMLKMVGEEKVVESYSGEQESYIKALADSYVFTKDAVGKGMVARAKDEKEVIRFALGFEKDSILLYYEMLDLVPSSQKGGVEEIIKEEKSHVRKLNGIRASI